MVNCGDLARTILSLIEIQVNYGDKLQWNFHILYVITEIQSEQLAIVVGINI